MVLDTFSTGSRPLLRDKLLCFLSLVPGSSGVSPSWVRDSIETSFEPRGNIRDTYIFSSVWSSRSDNRCLMSHPVISCLDHSLPAHFFKLFFQHSFNTFASLSQHSLDILLAISLSLTHSFKLSPKLIGQMEPREPRILCLVTCYE